MIRARLSGPPETATATKGRRSNPPIVASAAPSSSTVSGNAMLFPSDRVSAAETLPLGCSLLLDIARRLRKRLIQLSQRNARILFLIGLGQRHAEFQQCIRRLGAL